MAYPSSFAQFLTAHQIILIFTNPVHTNKTEIVDVMEILLDWIKNDQMPPQERPPQIEPEAMRRMVNVTKVHMYGKVAFPQVG